MVGSRYCAANSTILLRWTLVNTPENTTTSEAAPRLRRSQFLTVLLSAAFIEGFFLGPIGFRSAWRRYRDHDNTGNQMDAAVLGFTVAIRMTVPQVGQNARREFPALVSR